jgi:hypothetical protein
VKMVLLEDEIGEGWTTAKKSSAKLSARSRTQVMCKT